MNAKIFFKITFFVLLFSQTTAWASDIEVKLRDFDGTIMELPSRNVVFKKVSEQNIEEIFVDQQDFDHSLKHLGTEKWPWPGFEPMYDESDSRMLTSYRFMRSGSNGENYILEDVIKATKNISKQELLEGRFKAASYYWKELIEVFNDPKKVPYYYIVTARGHTEQEFIEVFKYFKRRGIIKYLPKEENIFNVTSVKYNNLLPKDMSIGDKKAKLIKDIIEKHKNQKNISFADDLESNLAPLREKMKKGEMPNILKLIEAKTVNLCIESFSK